VALFSHNVWAAPKQLQISVPVGAVNYIAPLNVWQESLFLNAAQWNALPNVQNDAFVQITVSGTANLQVASGGQMDGALLPATLA
jgi:hypothetical protein